MSYEVSQVGEAYKEPRSPCSTMDSPAPDGLDVSKDKLDEQLRRVVPREGATATTEHEVHSNSFPKLDAFQILRIKAKLPSGKFFCLMIGWPQTVARKQMK